MTAVDSPAGDWAAQAACRRHDPDWWFPAHPLGRPGPTGAKAIRICQQCPVIDQCAAWERANPDDWAIIAGTTAGQRRAAREGRPVPTYGRGCGWCGREFTGPTQQRYCTPEHKYQHERARKRKIKEMTHA